MNRRTSRFGWKPDLPDHRDFIFAAPEPVLADLPSSVDLRDGCPPVYDQLSLNSCTANAIAAAYQFELMKQGLPAFTPSRLFIYYNERVMENSVNSDNGAHNRDGLNSVSKQGVCTEDSWPYSVAEFAQKLFHSCYLSAMENIVTNYFSVNQDLDQMKGCLADGYPFIIGFTVYESFDSDDMTQSGVLNMPEEYESVVGSHAVLVVGYDDNDDTGRFIVRNSWGPNWGQAGYFTMPYEYLLHPKLSSDFWTIRMVSDDIVMDDTTN